MSTSRLLTTGEAMLLSQAAERWLRLRDVEINLGELALGVLARTTLRPAQCGRQDIASLGWTVEAKFQDTCDPVALTLVAPESADLARGRVSVLSAVGLSFIGKALGAIARVPLPSGKSVDARVVALRPCRELVSARSMEDRGDVQPA